MNTYQRHGDRVRIATAADFNGTRWTTMALRLEMPRGASYLMPAGAVMRLFKRHNGRDAVAVTAAPPDLDIAASRTGDRLFLHVANLAYARPTAATLAVDGRRITAGRVLEIAPTDLRLAANETRPDAFAPTEKPLPVTPDRHRHLALPASLGERRRARDRLTLPDPFGPRPPACYRITAGRSSR